MDNLTDLEQAMRNLFRSMKRPQYWALVTTRAGIAIDRPAAIILHILAANSTKHFRGNDLAQHLGIEAPSVTRKVQELERAGYIMRRPDPKDGRATNFEVTAVGKFASEQLWEAQRSITSEVFANWTVDEQQQFTNLFQRFTGDLMHITTQTPERKDVPHV